MIINVNEKIDITPEWFMEQSKRNSEVAWQERLCELLSVYKIHDEIGAHKAGEMLKKAGVNEELIHSALE